MWRRTCGLFLLMVHGLATTGCTVWTRTPVTTLAEPMPSRVKVWVHDTAFVVHDPVVHNDSLRGWERSGERRGVEFAWPAAQIDSLRTRQVTASGTILVGLIGAITLLTIIAGLAAAGSED